MNTVSIEVAKELYELGWRKETTFVIIDGTDEVFYRETIEGVVFEIYKHYNAPQLHEILEVLPDQITIFDKKRNGFEGRSHYWLFYKMNVDEEMNHTNYGLYHIDYSNALSRDTLEGSEFLDKNPHDAAAKLLIWCIKNKFVTL